MDLTSSKVSDSDLAEKTYGSTDPVIEADEDAEQGCNFCAPERPLAAFVKLLACVLAGLVFGWALEKSRVFEPESIRLQMVFERWIMLKMFLAAMATGQLVLAIISIIPATKSKFDEGVQNFSGCFGDKGLLTSTLGPLALGSGMTVSGACPGMVLPQVGSWTKNAIYTFIGVLAGALLYGLIAPFVVRFTKPKQQIKSLTIWEKFNLPFYAFALPMSILLWVAVILMEVFINWQDDLPLEDRNYNATSNFFILKSWPPSSAGALIGLLQLVIVFAVGDTLGGSSSYMTLVSQWVIGKKLQSTFPHLAKYRCGIGNWWQALYVLAAMAGGCLSAVSSNSLATAKGVSIPAAVCGGFLLILGARFGAGCTSGHGLSGAALLYWFSLIAVPFMFAGGIATAFAMKATGALYDFDAY